MERLQTMPDWPARMQASVAAVYMGISEASFLTRFGGIGVKEGANRLWSRRQLDLVIAKQFALPQPAAPADSVATAEIDTWADL